MPIPPIDDEDYVFVVTSPRKAAELIKRLRFERALCRPLLKSYQTTIDEDERDLWDRINAALGEDKS